MARKTRGSTVLLSIASAVLAACGGTDRRTRTRIGEWLRVIALLIALAACPGPPSTTPEFAASGTSSSTVSLSWKPVAGATAYRIDRKSGADAYAQIATAGSNATGFIDKGLTRNTTYTYRLTPQGVRSASPEQSATTGEEDPITTEAGTAVGEPVTKVIGAAGGNLTAAGGHATLTIPPGAVDHDTGFSLQGMTNTAPEGEGDGVRVSADADLKKPVTIAFGFGADGAPQAGGLGIAFQDDDGTWISLPRLRIDLDARTISVEAPLVRVSAGAGRRTSATAAPSGRTFVKYREVFMKPGTEVLPVKKSRKLTPYAQTVFKEKEDPNCGQTSSGPSGADDPLLAPLCQLKLITIPVRLLNSKPGFTRKWYVFLEEGGGAAFGTVRLDPDAGATYTAPASVPDPNPVWVTFRSVNDSTGQTVTPTAKILIRSDYRVQAIFFEQKSALPCVFGEADVGDEVDFTLTSTSAGALEGAITNNPATTFSPPVVPYDSSIRLVMDSNPEAINAKSVTARIVHLDTPAGSITSIEVDIAGEQKSGACTLIAPDGTTATSPPSGTASFGGHFSFDPTKFKAGKQTIPDGSWTYIIEEL